MKLSLALTPHQTVFAPLLYAGNLMHGLQRCAELGYDGVELNLRDPGAEDLDLITTTAQAHGLAIVSLGTGQAYLVDGLSVASADSAVRALLVERVKRHVDFAQRVGAQVVLGGVRGRFEGDAAARAAQYAGAVDVVRQLDDYATPRGVTLTLEPINRYESNFLNTVDETLAFLNDVERPNVKILLDTYHMNIEEADMCTAFKRAGYAPEPRASGRQQPPSAGHGPHRLCAAACHAAGRGLSRLPLGRVPAPTR